MAIQHRSRILNGSKTTRQVGCITAYEYRKIKTVHMFIHVHVHVHVQ